MNKSLNNQVPNNFFHNGKTPSDEDLPVKFLSQPDADCTSERDAAVISSFASLWKMQDSHVKSSLWTIVYGLLNLLLILKNRNDKGGGEKLTVR